jgi:hypothetical protein
MDRRQPTGQAHRAPSTPATPGDPVPPPPTPPPAAPSPPPPAPSPPGPAGQDANIASDSLTHAGPAAERFIWEHPFEGITGAQRGRILEWMSGVPWRDNTKGVDLSSGPLAKQLKSTEDYSRVGALVRRGTRAADAAVKADPKLTGKKPQTVVMVRTDAPATVEGDVSRALDPGRGRKIPANAEPPETVRGLPGRWGAIARGLTIIGTAVSAFSLGYDLGTGDYPMAGADTLSTVGGGLEIYGLLTAGAGAAISAGIILGGAGIFVASAISMHRAAERGDGLGVGLGFAGMVAGAAMVVGVIVGAPVLVIAGAALALGVGLVHLGRWLWNR